MPVKIALPVHQHATSAIVVFLVRRAIYIDMVMEIRGVSTVTHHTCPTPMAKTLIWHMFAHAKQLLPFEFKANRSCN